jgi:hypothetical protein
MFWPLLLTCGLPEGSKIEIPDIGFGILSLTLVFSIVGQQWQSYSGLVHSISYHEELS